MMPQNTGESKLELTIPDEIEPALRACIARFWESFRMGMPPVQTKVHMGGTIQLWPEGEPRPQLQEPLEGTELGDFEVRTWKNLTDIVMTVFPAQPLLLVVRPKTDEPTVVQGLAGRDIMAADARWDALR